MRNYLKFEIVFSVVEGRFREFMEWVLYRVGSILDFSFDIDIDTGQKTSDSISILVESVKLQWMSEKKTPCSRVG